MLYFLPTQTAYFVIPENVKHGEELICSYFACRNAGIKFRYCSHCKVPVAKRNFRKRHKHGGEDIAKGVGDDSGDEAAVKKGIPSQITANREVAIEADGISSQSADSTKEHVKKINEVDQGLVRSSMATFENTKNMSALAGQAADDGPPADESVSEKRHARWVSLLTSRPSTKQGDSMSGWLMEVLAVSDLATPLDQADDGSVVILQETAKKNESGDSPRSDNGYRSSNDETSVNDNVNEKKKDGDRTSSDPFNGGIVKKKRPADLLSKAAADGPPPAGGPVPYASGSFAEWKERKKQKKAMKDSGEE